MTVPLITALRAAETLAAYHHQRIDQTLGSRQAWHTAMANMCRGNIEELRRQLAAAGATPQNQAQAIRARDVEIAQRIVATHLLPEWRASEKAPEAMEALAQAIADAMQTTRGATTS